MRKTVEKLVWMSTTVVVKNYKYDSHESFVIITVQYMVWIFKTEYDSKFCSAFGSASSLSLIKNQIYNYWFYKEK